MHHNDLSNVDYSQLRNDEIEDIKEAEQKINKKRTESVILLAVDDK